MLNKEHFTLHLQYKHSGTFAKRKYEELSNDWRYLKAHPQSRCYSTLIGWCWRTHPIRVEQTAWLLLLSSRNAGRFESNLVPTAHVPFGQHQDTELWNNQFPETKILGLPVSGRIRGLVCMASRYKVDVDTFHKSRSRNLASKEQQYQILKATDTKTLEMSLIVDYSRAPCLGADQKARGLWERDCLESCISRILDFKWIFDWIPREEASTFQFIWCSIWKPGDSHFWVKVCLALERSRMYFQPFTPSSRGNV